MKRYKAIDFAYDDCGNGSGTALDIIEHKDGEYVKYEDVKILIENRNKAIDFLNKFVEYLENGGTIANHSFAKHEGEFLLDELRQIKWEN